MLGKLKGKTILRNRYILVSLGLLVYIVFFDAHDLLSQIGVKYKTHQIKKEIEYLDARTVEAEKQIEQLTSDDAQLEKFAREQYRMKRENEEVFVIINTEK